MVREGEFNPPRGVNLGLLKSGVHLLKMESQSQTDWQQVEIT
jgi:hypothetical protein